MNSLQEGGLVINKCCLQLLAHSSSVTVNLPSACHRVLIFRGWMVFFFFFVRLSTLVNMISQERFEAFSSHFA